MAFDPDAYLTESSPTTSGSFDPDAYLNATATAEPATVKPNRLNQAIKAFTPGGILKSAVGALETGAGMVSSIPAQALGGYAGIAGSLLPGDPGQGARWSEKVSNALTYRPMTEAGKNIEAAVAYPFEKANEGLGYVGEQVGGNAGRTIGENLIPVVGTVASGLPKVRKATANRIQSIIDNPETVRNQSAFPVRDEATGEITYYRPEQVEFARKNQPLIETHALARELGIKTNPAKTNPTKENVRLAERATEKHLEAALAKQNEAVWGNALRDDMGIVKDTPLSPEVIKEVRNNAAVPAQAIAEQGGLMAPTNDQLAAITRLRRESTIASPEIAGQSNDLVHRAMKAVEEGADASVLLREIADLRSDANKFYNATSGGPEMAAKAKSYKQLANILEDMVQSNLERLAVTDPYGQYAEMAKAYPEARAKMAKSYVLEEVTDFNTGKIDPVKLAKMTEDDSALTGAFQKVGKVVGNFPESAVATAKEPGFFETRYSRASTPALTGAIAGLMLPIPGGMATGSLLGIAAGETLGRHASRKVLTDRAQRAGVNTIPRELWDRSAQDPLTSRYSFERSPIEREFNRPPDTPPLLPAPPSPAGPRGPVEGAPAPYRHPNFQIFDNPPQPTPPGTAVSRGRPLTPEERFAQDKANFAAQDRTRYNRESAMDSLAMQKAEAEAAALRQSAGEGTVIGEKRPPVRMEPLIVEPTTLQRAADKIAKGRQFDLTAEERIAWSKAKGTIETLRQTRE